MKAEMKKIKKEYKVKTKNITAIISEEAEKVFNLLKKEEGKINQIFSSLEEVEKNSLRMSKSNGRFKIDCRVGDAEVRGAISVPLKDQGGSVKLLLLWARESRGGYECRWNQGLLPYLGAPEGNSVPSFTAAIVKAGEEGWRNVAKAMFLSIAYLTQNFYMMVGKEELLDGDIKELLDREEQQKRGEELATEIQRFQSQLESRRAELVNKEQEIIQLGEEIRKGQEKTARIGLEADLEAATAYAKIANLKLAIRKAIADLLKTKGISKSPKFDQIRRNLEAALCPLTVRQFLLTTKELPENSEIVIKGYPLLSAEVVTFASGEEPATADWRYPRMTGLWNAVSLKINDQELRWLQPKKITLGDIQYMVSGHPEDMEVLARGVDDGHEESNFQWYSAVDLEVINGTIVLSIVPKPK